ncbi:Hypothetical protein PHPALM_6609 [Phytophthora palmivora]|uniref:Uncharacterized protein n=1 Tax=Phytophthora palmivora TaxID=4796 RepID=A0A2P4YEG4_9STRA|nr:Hypothetical protein PHPALM_6609 [Phytophthora palmivora]
MRVAAESKARVEKRRLDFEMEKWSSEALRVSEQRSLEQERLAFEKTKWEKEREDREDREQERKQEHRFQVLSSLIEKDLSAKDSEEFLKLL